MLINPVVTSCRYTPTQPQDHSKGLITPYAEIRQLELPRPTTLMNETSHARTYRSFSQDDAMSYDFLKPPALPPLRQQYDSLDLSTNQHQNHTPSNSHFHQRNNNSSGSYAQVSGSPPGQKSKSRNKHVSTRSSKSPSASPGKSPARSVRQSLPPMASREEVLRLMEVDDMDTYVYMAPLSDYPEAAEQLGDGGRGRKEVEAEAETGSEVR